MKSWKRNAIIATVLSLVCVGVYLNWAYGEKPLDLTETLNGEKIMNDATLVMATSRETEAPTDDSGTQKAQSAAEYFATMRLSRQESRDAAVQLLQETISYADETEDVSGVSKQLERLVDFSLTEAQIESLVIAKGYVDCVAYMTEEGISLAVQPQIAGLTEQDVAILSDLITSQADYRLSQIRIVEVN